MTEMNINLPDWSKEFPCAITVCDREGIILFMNERSCITFQKYGGRDLIGKSLMGCHPEAARVRIAELIEKEETNAYTIEKEGVKKLIYQSPWYEDGRCMGLVELSLVLPQEMPHFIRA